MARGCAEHLRWWEGLMVCVGGGSKGIGQRGAEWHEGIRLCHQPDLQWGIIQEMLQEMRQGKKANLPNVVSIAAVNISEVFQNGHVYFWELTAMEIFSGLLKCWQNLNSFSSTCHDCSAARSEARQTPSSVGAPSWLFFVGWGWQGTNRIVTHIQDFTDGF